MEPKLNIETLAAVSPASCVPLNAWAQSFLNEQQTVPPRERGDGSEVEAATEEVRHEHRTGARRERRLQKLDAWPEGGTVEVHGDRPQPVLLDNADHVRVGDGGDQHLAPGRLCQRPEQEVEPRTHGETDQIVLARREDPSYLRGKPPAPRGPDARREPEE